MSPADAFEPLRFALERADIRYAIGGSSMAFKFDFFPAGAFTLGMEELDRAIYLSGTGLSETPAPFVTPEDILLAKLYWYRSGGEISEVQWRDVEGIVRGCVTTLDHKYLQQSAAKIEVRDLLDKALKKTAL